MIKFMLVSRRKPGDTQEKYFYEWGIIHVALMITTPSVMRTFRRYAQHFTVNGVDGDRLLYPLSDDGLGQLRRPLAGQARGQPRALPLRRLHAADAPAQLRRLELRHRVRARDVQGRAAGLRARRRQARARRQEPAGPVGGRVRRRVAGAARPRAAHRRRDAPRPAGAEPPRGGRQDPTSRARCSSWPASAATPASRSCGSTTSSPCCGSREDEAVRAAVLGEDFVRGSGRELLDGGDRARRLRLHAR